MKSTRTMINQHLILTILILVICFVLSITYPLISGHASDGIQPSDFVQQLFQPVPEPDISEDLFPKPIFRTLKTE